MAQATFRDKYTGEPLLRVPLPHSEINTYRWGDTIWAAVEKEAGDKTFLVDFEDFRGRRDFNLLYLAKARSTRLPCID